MKEKMNYKKMQGITLIALVITIIVLLILAGVSITSLSGEGGILGKANTAKIENEKTQLKEELELEIMDMKADKIIKGESLTQQEVVDKITQMGAIITNTTEDIIQGEYKDYEITIDEDYKVTVGGALTGEKPSVIITVLTTAENVELVEIQVEATTTDGDIESIEAMNGAIEKENSNNTNTKKIFTVSKNGIYYFRIKGTNGRTTIKQSEEIGNIINTSDLLTEIESIKTAGEQVVQVTGKTSSGNFEEKEYHLNVIMHKGNLVLDGEKEVAGVTPVNNIYEFGSEGDVGTASGNAQNTVVLKVEGNLTINENVTLTSVKSSSGYGGPKGLVVYCTGTLTNNGTITMTARGGKATGENVYLWRNANGSYEYVPSSGGAGAAGVQKAYGPGIAGTNATGRATGGGGSGGTNYPGGGSSGVSGAGGTGTSYSGGAGGGATYTCGRGHIGESGSSAGGAGGAGRNWWTTDSEGGGAGNPAGASSTGASRRRIWYRRTFSNLL